MKGQSSTEMIIAVSFLISFAILALITYSKRIEDSIWIGNTLDAKRICYKISTLITRVKSNGNGFSEKFYYDKDYAIIIEGNSGRINIGEDVICSFPTKEVSDGLQNKFSLTKGNYLIKNEDDLVVFEKI